jgi:hypothetical protein
LRPAMETAAERETLLAALHPDDRAIAEAFVANHVGVTVREAIEFLDYHTTPRRFCAPSGIPWYLFENDPVPWPLRGAKTPEQLAAFEAETARMKRIVEAERERRRKASPPQLSIAIERGEGEVTIRLQRK